jgi:glycosyltransferase involved in cell wall biosynthesis
LGRLVPLKGAHNAIKVARQLKSKLLIIGEYSRDSAYYINYWRKKIKPFIDHKIIFHSKGGSRQKVLRMVSQAKAFLFPIEWEEPFGLVMIEAMACGTPVIAFKRGSVPEIVKNGKTGFVVKNLREMIQAVKKIDQIDRRACRQRVEKKFTVEKMVENYEKLYYKLLAKSKK